MMVLEDLKQEMSLRNISRISGISLSGYYYRPVERHIQRLDPTIRNKIREIASERPTYGYRRVWCNTEEFRHACEPEDCQESPEG